MGLTSDWGRGAWMQTFTGKQFYPTAPSAEDIEIRDIAHALSMICRFGGHTKRFYSVAEHCVFVSRCVAPEIALWGLLHDAAEAYVGDMVRPLKYQLPDYMEAEDRIIACLVDRFRLDLESDFIPAGVKEADNRILLDERAAFLSAPPVAWEQEGLQPLGVRLQGWDPHTAELEFLDRFDYLTRSTA